jgi:S-methylmethionine-dependent homocysteine/selenocysteine methylase
VLDTVLGFAPDAVAVMHSPLAAMGPALERVREFWAGPLAAYAEVPYAEDPESGHSGPGIGPEAYAAHARHWLEVGATAVGGCCGTRPAHIAALRALVDG